MNLSTILKILEKECCTQISIETIHKAFAECDDLKMTPDQPLHHSLFCRGKKLLDHNKTCAENKRRSVKIASLGRSFIGSCPFGVRELVQPVMVNEKLAAVCYFTILSGTVEIGQLRKKARWLAEFIRLSINTYLLNHDQNPRRNNAEFYRKRCLYFLDLHYMENIGETDLAEYLGLNCTYFSSLFKNIMGKTFRQALTDRRIHEAKIYLRLHKSLRISYIARLCGFSDSNYFSSVFRKVTGCSPKNYRND